MSADARRDHPRSRGVYDKPLTTDISQVGSSPLARGLQELLEHVVLGRGIIPARAGFTESHAHFVIAARDHPRSRGVYALRHRHAPLGQGSSPLARGLPIRVQATPVRDRIIPARAGFTACNEWTDMRRADHPRSRGVYHFPKPLTLPERGSSPLARGLRTPPCVRPDTRTDHPRSRGVYTALRIALGRWPGSSPLARGLLSIGFSSRRGSGIIPARAGFTSGSGGGALMPRDHPRSRGVYLFRAPVSPLRFGSSPLARGLRTTGFTKTLCERIIPARAGFTFSKSTIITGVSDHPRSRGVYVLGPDVGSLSMGSSPLARGLL